VNKAYDYFQSKNGNDQPYFFVKRDKSSRKLNFDETLFVEAMENYVAIYTNEKKILHILS